MTTFTIPRRGSWVKVSWDKGVLSGHEPTCREIRLWAKFDEGRAVVAGPMWELSPQGHLNNLRAVCLIVGAHFPGYKLEGECPPPLPDIPEGAIP